MADVYNRFLAGELSLEDAAQLLREHAPEWGAEGDSLALNDLPDAQREKAGELFNAAIQPILAPFLAGEVSSEAAARQLAPLALPLGAFALNFTLPGDVASDQAMALIKDLVDKLAELE
jgi:hypothetical protein